MFIFIKERSLGVARIMARAIVVAALCIVVSGPALADGFLKIGGSSADDARNYEDWINLTSVSWSRVSPISGHARTLPGPPSGGSATLEITRTEDEHSATLQRYAESGEIIPAMQVAITTDTGNKVALYGLSNVTVRNYTISSGSAAGRAPTESMSLHFSAISAR